MSTEEKKIQIELLLEGIMVNEPEYFVVNSRVKPTNNFKIFIDGDNGITIEKCVQINRKLYKLIEEAGYFPEGDFSLEVSSPGIEEPLKIFRQYKKNIGRFVEVVLSDETKKEGKMIEVDETGITIEFTEGKGKKATKENKDKKIVGSPEVKITNNSLDKGLEATINIYFIPSFEINYNNITIERQIENASKEEVEKQKVSAARHNLSKKEGEAAYQDPIAQKLWGSG